MTALLGHEEPSTYDLGESITSRTWTKDPWKNCCNEVLAEPSDIITLSPRDSTDVSTAGPADNSLRSYIVGHGRELVGEPLYSGTCAYCSPTECQWHDVVVTVFPNGFRTCPTISECQNGAEVMSYIFEAFTLLSSVHDTKEGECTLRMTIFGICEDFRVHVFLFCHENAVTDCCSLTRVLDDALTMFTSSLFPGHVISVLPVPDVESTRRRIMAGYLLMYEDFKADAKDTVCVVYGELSSFWCGKASFMVYTNNRCVSVVESFEITQDMVLRTYNADHCSIFEVDWCRFCARTRAEMMLWTRALVNVKTKLMHAAPNPSKRELALFRSAVLEQVVLLKPIPTPSEALLPLKPRQPWPPAAEGDLVQLDPMEDASTLATQSDILTQSDFSSADNVMDVNGVDTGGDKLWAGFGIMTL